MKLNDEMIELLKREGCEIVGFADIRRLSGEARQGFRCGVLMALPFTREAMLENKNNLPQRYSGEYEPMKQRLGELKKLAAGFLAGKGYEVITRTPASVVNDEGLRSPLPLKTIATLAGIGWIGKCAMLVTHEVGSALRLTAVLTNAPFECGIPVTKSGCNPNCTACVNICPGKAPLGGLWEPGVDRDAFFDARACCAAARTRAKTLLDMEGEARCGLCISNCPFTKKGLGYQ